MRLSRQRLTALGSLAMMFSAMVWAVTTPANGEDTPPTPDPTTNITVPVPTVTVTVPGATITLPVATVTLPPIIQTIKPPPLIVPVPQVSIRTVTLPPLPRATVTKTVNATPRAVPTPTATVTKTVTATPHPVATGQPPVPSATLGPATPLDRTITKVKTKKEKVIRRVVIGSAIGLAAILGILGFFLAYGLGYKDAERSEDRFLSAMLGLGPYVPKHKQQ